MTSFQVLINKKLLMFQDNLVSPSLEYKQSKNQLKWVILYWWGSWQKQGNDNGGIIQWVESQVKVAEKLKEADSNKKV